MANLPYAQGTSTLEKMLDKIKTASVPERFSADFVSTKLSMKGGSARSIIPFIKKMGLVDADGTPTDRYKEFRNSEKSKQAIADAIKELYEPLFQMNEYVYELDTHSLKNLIVEYTGAEPNSSPVKKILSTFQSLVALASFDTNVVDDDSYHDAKNETNKIEMQEPLYQKNLPSKSANSEGINLSYTINLNLPPTTDIEVFNAIFKSLRQHLLQD